MITQAKTSIHKPKPIYFNAQLTSTPNGDFHLTPLAVPSSISKALAIPKWYETMKQEIDTLLYNDTWELVECPKHNKSISCK